MIGPGYNGAFYGSLPGCPCGPAPMAGTYGIVWVPIVAAGITAAAGITTAVISGAQKKRERAEARLMLAQQAEIARQEAARQEAATLRVVAAKKSAVIPVIVVAGLVALPLVYLWTRR